MRNQKIPILFLIFVFFENLYYSIPTYAETIVLKSGQRVEGKILERDDKHIKIDFYGSALTYYIDEIKSIDENSPIIKTYEEIASQADKESKESLEKNPNSVQAWNERGIAYRMNGNQEKAIECFTKAVEIDSNDAESYAHRGLSYASSKMQKYDLAFSDFNKAIQLNPNNGEYYFNRALIYGERKEYDKVWDDVEKAQHLGFRVPLEFLGYLKGVSASYYNARGFNYAKEGKSKLAMSDYNRAIQLDPGEAIIYANRANLYADMGQLNQAISDYSKAIAINPKDPSVYHDRGSAYSKKGNFDQAISDYNKVAEIDPSWAQRYNGQFYNDRAIPYFFKKDYNRAWEDVNKAIELGYRVHPDFLSKFKKASGRDR